MKKFLKIALALGVVAGLSAGAALAQDAPKYGMNVGDVAKPVMIKTVDGDEFDTGKVDERTMFVFVNSVCGMCAKEMTDLAKDRESFSELKVYLVSVDMDLERAKSRYAKFMKVFDMLYDPELAFGEVVGLSSTPATLILDKGGKIVFKKSGYRAGGLEEVKAAL
jgi:peroxiredoxin